MAVYKRPARSRFTLFLLILTSVTLLTLDYRGTGAGVIGGLKDGARDLVAPVQDFSDRVFEPVGNFVGGIVHHGDVKAENRRLREENAALRGEALEATDAQREREALLDILDIEFVGDVPRVDARVISTSPSNADLTVELDKGTNAGIAEDMPVVTGTGLVGRVVDVSKRRSTVRLVTDKTMSVGVRMSTSGDVGVANGQGLRKALTVDLIDPATPIAKDEIVVTSGLQQSQYPPGIPVGKVRDAKAETNQLQQTVTIDPVVDMRRLTFVTVLQWSPRA